MHKLAVGLAAFLLLTHWYLGHSTNGFFKALTGKSCPLLTYGIYVVLTGVTLADFFFPMRVFSVVGDVWMGVFVYLLLFSVAGGLCLLILGRKRKKPRIIVGIAVALLTAAVSVYGLYHAGDIRLKEYRVSLGQPCGETVALISDLHLGATGSVRNLERTVKLLREQKPDLVCISGDVFNGSFAQVEQPEQVQKLLRSIQAPLGVYACLGNHDSGTSQQTGFLQDCGIRLLREEAATVGDKLTLVGRADRGSGISRGNTATLMASVSGELPVIVLDHNPARIGEYTHADLILCGHTHRGQIFPGNLITGSIYEVDYGYYRRDGASPQVIVTSGACYWGPPLRVGSDSEVVLIRLD